MLGYFSATFDSKKHRERMDGWHAASISCGKALQWRALILCHCKFSKFSQVWIVSARTHFLVVIFHNLCNVVNNVWAVYRFVWPPSSGCLLTHLLPRVYNHCYFFLFFFTVEIRIQNCCRGLGWFLGPDRSSTSVYLFWYDLNLPAL